MKVEEIVALAFEKAAIFHSRSDGSPEAKANLMGQAVAEATPAPKAKPAPKKKAAAKKKK